MITGEKLKVLPSFNGGWFISAVAGISLGVYVLDGYCCDDFAKLILIVDSD